MTTTVDHNLAKQILINSALKAEEKGFVPSSQMNEKIKEVILGSHLTFRYILITNLLAKSVNSCVHTLALQAKAELDGAFDSRSLCHKVFVPFEREKLGGKLGRSNEPYLNKPARFTLLSKDNPVRKGYDHSILLKCIEILNSVKDKVSAESALIDALYYTMQRNVEVAEIADIDGDATLHKMLYSFGTKLISKSNEGETSAILAGLSFAIYGKILKKNLEIRVHPVNQAGSSSNETLDIDIYLGKELFCTAEIKDKHFSYEDVDHAANKVRVAGLDSFFFILGPQAAPVDISLEALTSKIADTNVKVTFASILDFYSTLLGFAPKELDAEYIWAFVEKVFKEARVKDLTREHVIHCAKQVGLIS